MRTRSKEYAKWVGGKYPYDFAAACGECAAAHGFGLCHRPEHAAMVIEAEKLKLNSIIERGIRVTDRAKFVVFREKFAQFYAKA